MDLYFIDRGRRKQASLPTPVTIRGTDVKVVEDSRYLGVQMNWSWNSHVDIFTEKVQVLQCL